MIADIAKERDLFLICDEVYREFCYDDSFESPPWPGSGTWTRTWSLWTPFPSGSPPAARGWAAWSPGTRKLQLAVLKFCQSRLSVATIDQVGAAALYGVDHEFFRRSKEEYRKRRDTVVRRLRAIPGVQVEEPMGAFYLMAGLPVDDSDKFQRWLLEEFDYEGETVMFAPGAPFYETPGKGINEVRIAYVRQIPELSGPWTCWKSHRPVSEGMYVKICPPIGGQIFFFQHRNAVFHGQHPLNDLLAAAVGEKQRRIFQIRLDAYRLRGVHGSGGEYRLRGG